MIQVEEFIDDEVEEIPVEEQMNKWFLEKLNDTSFRLIDIKYATQPNEGDEFFPISSALVIYETNVPKKYKARG